MNGKLVIGALSIAVGAALAGVAHAAERPDDRAGLLGVGGATAVAISPDAFERAVQRQSVLAAGPDAFERAVQRQPGTAVAPDVFERAALRAEATPLRPDDRAEARGPGLVPGIPTTAAAPAGDGTSWGDVLVGAAAMLGAVLLAGATAFTIRHRGRVILP